MTNDETNARQGKRFRLPRFFFVSIAFLALMEGGCASHLAAIPTSRPVMINIGPPIWDDVLKSRVTPPAGWKPDPLKVTDKSRHRVWISPGGSTAYGVIYFDLPLPVGVDLAFSGFLSGMKKASGEAILIFKSEDANGIHFVADGGLYRIRCNMIVSGFHGWVVYTGSLRAKPVNPEELRIAERARDQSEVGPR